MNELQKEAQQYMDNLERWSKQVNKLLENMIESNKLLISTQKDLISKLKK